jgi:hypothetical protein
MKRKFKFSVVIHYWSYLDKEMFCGTKVSDRNEGSSVWKFVTCKKCLAKRSKV